MTTDRHSANRERWGPQALCSCRPKAVEYGGRYGVSVTSTPYPHDPECPLARYEVNP